MAGNLGGRARDGGTSRSTSRKTYYNEPSEPGDPLGVPDPCWVGLAPSSQGNEAQQVRDCADACCFPPSSRVVSQGWTFEPLREGMHHCPLPWSQVGVGPFWKMLITRPCRQMLISCNHGEEHVI